VVGVVFGVLAVAAGFTVVQTCAMSLLVFTGASQFAAVSVIAAGGTAVAAAGSALLLAGRNALYGPVVAPWLHGDSIPVRAAAAQLIIDESTAIGAAQTAGQRRRGFLSAGLSVYVMWNLGTLIGAVGGDLLGDLDAWGLDAAFPAAFVALLIPHLQRRTGRIAAAVGAGVAAVSVPLVPAGVPVLLAVLGAFVGAIVAGRSASPLAADTSAGPHP